MDDMMEKMMEGFLGKMSKEEKLEMMGRMMEKFMSDFTPEDKQRMMERMMPRMMEGVNMMEMMPKMMMKMMGEGGGMGMMSGKAGGEGIGMPMMGGMMMQMMPMCLSMMLPRLPKEKRGEFALTLVSTVIERASGDMSEPERAEFLSKIAAQARR